ncbi:pyruvate, phosphate dikinase [Oscillospiraceae bacterium HV4-5-C5C]|nr:pyruvate, phosphate dikinase [Oscillospiraceae bacterium HV4-5-C5C]
MGKFVYLFSEGNAGMRNLLGGKGANLAEMTRLGLPVPRGFTLTTEACTRYYEDGQQVSQAIEAEILAALRQIETQVGKKLGDPADPFLVSVRSGARASMPGMMDTILNLGLNDDTAAGLGRLTRNPRFALDSYRRFIMMFGDVVKGVEKKRFEAELDQVKQQRQALQDTDLDAEAMAEVVARFKKLYRSVLGQDFPQDPQTQLLEAIQAVFRSWNNERAIYYRRQNNIPSSWGTAVNIQEMVYGNMGETSGTGVAFTRSPSTGENRLFGEFLLNAQGEDVVAGVRTPQPIASLQDILPEAYDQFCRTARLLEQHYQDMQDMEFTIERGKLFLLQTRNGKRTAAAALKIAVDMVGEGLLTKAEALDKIDARSLDALLHPGFAPEALKEARVLTRGLPASPGAAAGKIYFTAEKAQHAHIVNGEKVILVRLETSPEDIVGMSIAEGILTGRGGMTSHAAVVARGMGRCCVSGCAELRINEAGGYLIDAQGERYEEGDELSLDGSTGLVYQGAIQTVEAVMGEDFSTIMAWADEIRQLAVRTNADTPADARSARTLGAEGIGLTRTEHMFFEPERIFRFRQMILAESEARRREALDLLLPIQQGDFEAIYKEMAGLPVTIRLLDPPLHEFLPQKESEIAALAEALGISADRVRDKVTSLQELNPMMGHRGCRLAVSYPEIAEMQTTAIIQAALAERRRGNAVVPEIMIPLVCDLKELAYVKGLITRTADRLIEADGGQLSYKVGTMIEIPRAALLADEIAQEADFFSFGTNDLTQLTFGLSRDDAGRILEDYYAAGIFESDPTANLDVKGVGRLMKLAVQGGRATRPELKLGICGEHGGDPDSVIFCHELGLNYVSCSPFRVPIARLAAAQAQIRQPRV